jgi:hypothetical protein
LGKNITAEIGRRALIDQVGSGERSWITRHVPEVQDFDSLLLREDSIVDMQRRMKDAAHSRKTFDGFAEARKTPEKIYMVQKRGDELLGTGRMVLPGPSQNLMQIG